MKITMQFEGRNSAMMSATIDVPSRSTFVSLASRLYREYEAINKIALGQEKPDSILIEVVGANKIQVIKAIREITGLGLREAKELTEADMNTRWVPVPESKLKWASELLAEAGATVSIGVRPKLIIER